MKNLLRVLRLALQYRLTFLAAAVCSLSVALLWGANIGTVGPIVEVVIKGKSLQHWVNQEIEDSGSTDTDRFWVTDLSIGYRLPKRLGTISLCAKNLFNEKFSYQDYNFNTDEALTPMYIPEQTLFVRVALAF